MARLTLYIPDEDYPLVKRALKLVKFYDDASLSSLTVKRCKEIVKKYDNKNQP